VRNSTVHDRNSHQAFLGFVDSFGNSTLHVGTFGNADADPGFAVTDGDQGLEAEAASTFDYAGDTVDADNIFFKDLFIAFTYI
jgi:hypothetical protein